MTEGLVLQNTICYPSNPLALRALPLYRYATQRERIESAILNSFYSFDTLYVFFPFSLPCTLLTSSLAISHSTTVCFPHGKYREVKGSSKQPRRFSKKSFIHYYTHLVTPRDTAEDNTFIVIENPPDRQKKQQAASTKRPVAYRVKSCTITISDRQQPKPYRQHCLRI